jgi:predicted dehydrogenase
MIDTARWLVGDMARISAQLGIFVDRLGANGGRVSPANDSAFLLTEFTNGAQGMIHASAVAHVADRGFQEQVKLYGEAGSLEIDFSYGGAEAGAVIRGARNQDERFQTLETPASYWGEVSRSDPFEIFNQQSAGCRAFIDAILGDQPATPTFYDGYKAQQVMDAAIEAHRAGHWVTIEDSPGTSVQ